jgi:hypothetical protein
VLSLNSVSLRARHQHEEEVVHGGGCHLPIHQRRTCVLLSPPSVVHFPAIARKRSTTRSSSPSSPPKLLVPQLQWR